MTDRTAQPVARRRFLAFALLVAIALLASAPQLAAAQQPAPKVVKLVIDYGDGVQKHFTSIPWKADMTVLDVMIAAREHPRGIKFSHRGEAAAAFLTAIDDLKNEGRGRNWIFEVGGKLADRSFAVHGVQPSDTVLWEFRKYQ